MNNLRPEFRRTMRSMEKHFADQAEQREDKAIAAHMAAVNASLGKPSKLRQGRPEACTSPSRSQRWPAPYSACTGGTSINERHDETNLR
ncbi:hypothetical protein [Janthinobacterium lividum]|uniref:hypothetical protein n=1 Tax=Janthinobacterium lividum TaxID=29581 RepID=UPI001B838123|nr:hypothetical protein [Janthinobacterium lividum]MBR7635086.1 hypothetical protein [Janthinobacterium lividum]